MALRDWFKKAENPAQTPQPEPRSEEFAIGSAKLTLREEDLKTIVSAPPTEEGKQAVQVFLSHTDGMFAPSPRVHTSGQSNTVCFDLGDNIGMFKPEMRVPNFNTVKSVLQELSEMSPEQFAEKIRIVHARSTVQNDKFALRQQELAMKATQGYAEAAMAFLIKEGIDIPEDKLQGFAVRLNEALAQKHLQQIKAPEI